MKNGKRYQLECERLFQVKYNNFERRTPHQKIISYFHPMKLCHSDIITFFFKKTLQLSFQKLNNY